MAEVFLARTTRRAGPQQDPRHQEDPHRVRAQPPVRHDVRRRGEDRARPQPPEHHPGVRLRRGRRHLLPRDGVRRGHRPPAPAAGGREGARRACPTGCRAYIVQQLAKGLDYAHRKTDEFGAAARHRPPRYLAAEHPAVVGRRREDRRLRHRARARRPRGTGRHQGQVRVHVARAGARRAGRLPQRRVRRRHRAVRAGVRAAAVPRQGQGGARDGQVGRDPAAARLRARAAGVARARSS